MDSRGQLANYAIRADQCGGRRFAEPEDRLRDPFELDRHRVVECAAFRRLERKTQVFLAGRHDHFRTRLTHTLEVAQIARCLARNLFANETLAETIALAHDLGHPPFGHAGESALAKLMTHHGRFNHNLHAVRVVEYLEHPFPPFRGLNLTRETLAGLLSHVTGYDTPESQTDLGDSSHASSDRLDVRPSLESQMASLADRLAYNGHDIEDAIGAGLLTVEQLSHVTLWQTAFSDVIARFPGTNVFQVRRAVLDRMLDVVLTDAVQTTTSALREVGSVEELRSLGKPVVTLSPDMERKVVELEEFLLSAVYKHTEILAMDATGKRVVESLFRSYQLEPSALPPRYRDRIAEQGAERVICDYIAGMTDAFCLREQERFATMR